jgi:hypothetical protein
MGNCVDKFLKKRLDKSLIKIISIRKQIRERIKEREESNDYFNTGCYEKDFADIIELRNLGREIELNCNKFLERISEQYSKLN